MRGKDVSDALNGAPAQYIDESKPKNRKKKKGWIAAVAAVLVISLTLGVLYIRGGKPQNVRPVPGALQAYAVGSPEYPKMAPYPSSELDSGYDKWWEGRRERYAYGGQGEAFMPFFARVTDAAVTGRQENTVFSPVSVFMALAMLTELTDGETRAQILNALGVSDLETLRQKANAVWNANFCNDGATASILGSSVWLDQSVNYKADTLQRLAQDYYAGSFRGSFAEADYAKAIRTWLNEQTGDLLKDAAEGLTFDANTVMALFSTVYFRAKWNDQFEKSQTKQDVFHALSGDETADFMHRTETYGVYYWGARFGAVQLNLRNGGSVWFFLPDEGVTPDQLAADPEVWQVLDLTDDWEAQSAYENQKSLRVNLSVPRFDVHSDLDLIEAVKKLGVSDCFDMNAADFSPLTGDTPVAVSQLKHAARVAVDEEGVIAAAYTAIIGAGAAMPPEDEMDFTLDRPFFFAVTGLDALPLFTGTVFHVQ